MAVLKRIIGIVLIVIAAIVAIQTVLEPIYHTSTEESPTAPLGIISTGSLLFQ